MSADDTTCAEEPAMQHNTLANALTKAGAVITVSTAGRRFVATKGGSLGDLLDR
jgi:hypothetical protein